MYVSITEVYVIEFPYTLINNKLYDITGIASPDPRLGVGLQTETEDLAYRTAPSHGIIYEAH